MNVPFRQQPQWDYCGAASVLMWRLKNGGSEVAQSQIYTWMGGAGAGVSPQQIASASRYWAGSDAILDWGTPDPAYKGPFFAKQIQSIDQRIPVIPIVEGGYHAGVINGGTWGRDANGTLNIWHDVYFHDPKGLANRYFSSAAWMSYSESGYQLYYQVISNGATYGWQNNYGSYSSNTVDSEGDDGDDQPDEDA